MADLKGGRVDITPESLAAKYGVTVKELKQQARALERNIWNKRMGVPETELKWLVDEGNNLDNTLNNLYKGKIVVYQKDKVNELFYDAFGNPKNKKTYDPEKWKAIRKNLKNFIAIKEVLIKKYPNLNFELDHPLAKSTLRNYLEAKPEELVRVNPMTKQLNRGFKKVLDDRYGKAVKEKNIVKLNAIDKIAKDLNVSFGKVNQDFKTFDYGPASKSFENLNMGEEIGKALTQQQNLSKNFSKYAKANPALFTEAGFSENAYKKLVEKGVPDVGLKQESLKRLVVQLGKTNADNICDLVAMKAANGGRIGFAKGGNCAGQIADAFDENPQKFAQTVNKTEGLAPRLKNMATGFLTALKAPGGFKGKVALGAGAVIGGFGAGALVKQFRNDDPSTYLNNEGQMEGMLISDVEEAGSKVEDNPILNNQFKLEALAAAGITAPIAKGVYNTQRFGTPQLLETPMELDQEMKTLKRTVRQITHPGGKKAKRIGAAAQETIRMARQRMAELNKYIVETTDPLISSGKGPIRSALGLSGVLGKGLWAFTSPIVALPSTAMYIAKDKMEGKSTTDALTNPLTYLGPAFMNQSVKALSKAGASRGLLAIASAGLAGTAAAPLLPAIAIGSGIAAAGSLGYQAYKKFFDKTTDEDFFNR